MTAAASTNALALSYNLDTLSALIESDKKAGKLGLSTVMAFRRTMISFGVFLAGKDDPQVEATLRAKVDDATFAYGEIACR
jgi:hypothetical protein